MRPSSLGGRGLARSSSKEPPKAEQSQPTTGSLFSRPVLKPSGRVFTKEPVSGVLPTKSAVRAPTGGGVKVGFGGTAGTLSSLLKEQRQMMKKPDSAPVQQRTRPAPTGVFARLTGEAPEAPRVSLTKIASKPEVQRREGWMAREDHKISESALLPKKSPVLPQPSSPPRAITNELPPKILPLDDNVDAEEEKDEENTAKTFPTLLGRFSTTPPTISRLRGIPNQKMPELKLQLKSVDDWPTLSPVAHTLLEGRKMERPFSTFWSEGDYSAWRVPGQCSSSNAPGGISWGIFCCGRCRLPIALLQHTHRLSGGFAGFSKFNAQSLRCELFLHEDSNAALVVLCEGCDGFVGTMVCESVQGDSPNAPTHRSSVECLRSNFSTLHLVTSNGVGISSEMLPSVLSERFDTDEDDIPSGTVTKKQPNRAIGGGASNSRGKASSRMAELEYDDETPSNDSDEDDDDYSKSEALRRLKSQGEDWENGGVTVPRANRSKYNSVRDYLEDDSEDDSDM